MSDSMFQKELNDQIGVNDIDIPNPAPGLLDELFPTASTKVFVAKPMVVVKMIFDGATSLSAFSGDPICSYYVAYPRNNKGSKIFLCHYQDDSQERLFECAAEDFTAEAQNYIPADLRI
jgi:hypothetical protein